MRELRYGKPKPNPPDECPVCGIKFWDEEWGQAGTDEILYHALEHSAEINRTGVGDGARFRMLDQQRVDEDLKKGKARNNQTKGN